MVDTPFDPIRVPSVTLSESELQEISDQIDNDLLPKDYLRKYRENLVNVVFGHGHQVDKQGRPIEQGMGSAQNMTQHAIDAFTRFNKDKEGYEKELAVLQRQLVESNARRRREAEAKPWAKHL